MMYKEDYQEAIDNVDQLATAGTLDYPEVTAATDEELLLQSKKNT